MPRKQGSDFAVRNFGGTTVNHIAVRETVSAPVQLTVTIAAIGNIFLTNRFTGSLQFEKDFMESEAPKARLSSNLDRIMWHVAED